MRSLVCTLRSPLPVSNGGDLRSWQTLKALTTVGEVGLFALSTTRMPPNDTPAFLANIWYGAYTGDAAESDLEWLKREGGLPSDRYFQQESAAQLQRALDEFRPDVVVLEVLWMHTYEALARSTGAAVILNAHNIEGPLAREIAVAETHPAARLVRRQFAARVSKVEQQIFAKADQLWLCSEADRERALTEYGAASASKIHVVPNAVDVPRYTRRTEPPPELLNSTGPIFIYPASFGYAPNVRAANFLLTRLFPALRARYPDARLALVGSDPGAAILTAAERTPGALVTGRVPETLPWLQNSSMMLVPLFEGGGTRFKILEAFAAGLPVISTLKGAEGLGAVNGEHLLLAETLQEFVHAVDSTLTHGDATKQRVESARERARRAADDATHAILHAVQNLRPISSPVPRPAGQA